MPEFKEVMIQIRRKREWETHRAVSSQQASCNIIERACVEVLKQPWTRSDQEITCDISDLASPPLGRCELDWGWDDGSATFTDTFIVVEEVKGTPHSVILGPTVTQLPFAKPWNEVYTFAMSIRSKEQLQEQREKARLAALRRLDEKAQHDAKIREGREKKKREEQDIAQRSKLA